MTPLLPALPTTTGPGPLALLPSASSSPSQTLPGAGPDFAGLLGTLLPDGEGPAQAGGSALALVPAVPTSPPPVDLAKPPALPALPGDTPPSVLRLPHGTVLPEAGAELPQARALPEAERAPDTPSPAPSVDPLTVTLTPDPAPPVAADVPGAEALAIPAAAPIAAEAAVPGKAAHEPPIEDNTSTPPDADEPSPLVTVPSATIAVVPASAAVLAPPPVTPTAAAAAAVVVAVVSAAPSTPVPAATRTLRHAAAPPAMPEDAAMPARVALPASSSDGAPDSAGAAAPAPAAVPGDTPALSAALSDALSDAPAPSAPAAAPAPPASTLIAAAPPAPASPVPEPAAPRPPAPQQETAIAQVGELREAMRAARPEMTLRHAEFGNVSLRVEPTAAEGWRAVLASRDPGFVPAIQAALAERAVAATADTSGSGTFTGSGMGQNGAGDHRYGSSHSGGQGSSQPYLGQSGSRDDEAAPDHRRPQAATALAARAEEGEGPGSSAARKRDVFA